MLVQWRAGGGGGLVCEESGDVAREWVSELGSSSGDYTYIHKYGLGLG